MTLAIMQASLDRATFETSGVPEFPARFMLYPPLGAQPAPLAQQVESDLQPFDPSTTLDTGTERPLIILTLERRMLLPGPDAFDAAYAMAKHWNLDAAEPELYTDYFPETDTLPGTKGRDESVRDACWAPVEPAIDGQPYWALKMMRVQEAWNFSALQGRPEQGSGIVVAQPDTGVTDHPELQNVQQHGAVDLIAGGTKAIDPLDYMGNTSHGTGTGSVLLSRSTSTVTGSAPAAVHMPIRAIHSVMRISQLRVAQAINHAVDNGAHVISMSLGGLPSLVLWHALRRAVRRDLIVLAAAGNCVRTVVWPARYDDCIAVAGVNIREQPWRGSCRGGAVAVSAPAENVLKALAVKNAQQTSYSHEQGQGTSFAVAMTAGVAALWLAHHGRTAVIAAARAQGVSVQALFKRLLMGTAHKPTEWDESEMGAGIVNAEALLQAPLDFDAGNEGTATEAPPGASIQQLLDEAAAGEKFEEDVLDLYGMELAMVALEARRCCEGTRGGEENTQAAVSEALSAAVPDHVLARLRAPVAASVP